jgi:hypothetical protein
MLYIVEPALSRLNKRYVFALSNTEGVTGLPQLSLADRKWTGCFAWLVQSEIELLVSTDLSRVNLNNLLLQILNFNHAFLKLRVSTCISDGSNSKLGGVSFYLSTNHICSPIFFVYAI